MSQRRPLWHTPPVRQESRPPVPDVVRRRLEGTAPWWRRRLAAFQKIEVAKLPHPHALEDPHRGDRDH
jgi:hypothetical protein